MTPPDAKTVIGGFVVVAFLGLCFVRIPFSNAIPDDVFYVMIGALAREFAGVVGYYFGAGKTSSVQTDTINKLAGKQ